jgi:competence protein ComFC
LSCESLSFGVVCKKCEESLIVPKIKRELIGAVEVVTLFGYSEIEQFILSKYETIGWRVYRYFAKRFLREFLESFQQNFQKEIFLVGIDEYPKSVGFSHTSILAHYSSSEKIAHLPASLIAKNRVSYAGKSREFRLRNKREFEYKGLQNIDVVLIDDVVTTGSTINEAKEVLEKNEVNLLFALVLADAKR